MSNKIYYWLFLIFSNTKFEYGTSLKDTKFKFCVYVHLINTNQTKILINIFKQEVYLNTSTNICYLQVQN